MEDNEIKKIMNEFFDDYKKNGFRDIKADETATKLFNYLFEKEIVRRIETGEI